MCGAYLGEADETILQKLRTLGMLLGRAFQIQDDILDAEGTSHVLGKKTRKDVSLGKGIVSLIGLAESKLLLVSLETEMFTIARDPSYSHFVDIIDFVVHRQH